VFNDFLYNLLTQMAIITKFKPISAKGVSSA
jgi:hypothetical protein